MKSLFITLLLISGFAVSGFKNAESEASTTEATLKVKYYFENVEEGYDHLNKTEVYIDGVLAGTSTVRKETDDNVVICKTTKGNHHIRIINYAYYKDVWEVHDKENNYSIDCKYEGTIDLKKKRNKIKLEFDLDSGTKRVK